MNRMRTLVTGIAILCGVSLGSISSGHSADVPANKSNDIYRNYVADVSALKYERTRARTEAREQEIDREIVTLQEKIKAAPWGRLDASDYFHAGLLPWYR